MNNENLQVMIERYKKQLIEFSQKTPYGGYNVSAKSYEEAVPSAAQMAQETQNKDMEKDVEREMEQDMKKDMEPDMEPDMEQDMEPDMERDMERGRDMDTERDIERYLSRLLTDEEPVGDRERFRVLPGLTDEEMQNVPEGEMPLTNINRSAPNGEYKRPYTGTEEEYFSYDEFLEKNPHRGVLEVKVFASGGAIPIKDARVVVSKTIGNKTYVFYDKKSDMSGDVKDLVLPSKRRELSEAPNEAVPFATYSVSVEHPDYENTTLRDVIIFDGVDSILPVELVPISKGGNQPESTT